MLFTVFSRLIHYKRKKNISQNFNTTINISIPAINENLITYSMSKNENLRDLNWLTQAIETEALNLNSVSFYLFQPSSNCHQESENSININISKENNFHFSLILIALGTSGKAKSTLENIGFHQVSWELEQIKNLGVLLENGENIKQILFQRNKFSPECLSVFTEIVKRNIILKDISFSESGIGSTGAGLIASALKVNNCLEDVQIWEDSIGLKGAEELSKMIEANSTLKLLTIFDSSSVIATPIISAVLARNRAMEVHIWSHVKGEKISKVVEFVPENNTLRIYKLDLAGSCRAVCALGWNTTVKTLDMTGIKLKSQWAKEFRWVLEQNRTLKEVNLSKTCLKNKGVVYVSAGLFKNKKLETLYLDGNWFSAVGVEHLLCPLSRFSSLISINVNGIHVRVELGGQFGYYIDILACSAHNITETLRLIRQLIIPTIQSLCQNIILTESIIRPECVKNLTPPRYRKNQIVSLQNLKEALLSVPLFPLLDKSEEAHQTTIPGNFGLKKIHSCCY